MSTVSLGIDAPIKYTAVVHNECIYVTMPDSSGLTSAMYFYYDNYDNDCNKSACAAREWVIKTYKKNQKRLESEEYILDLGTRTINIHDPRTHYRCWNDGCRATKKRGYLCVHKTIDDPKLTGRFAICPECAGCNICSK